MFHDSNQFARLYRGTSNPLFWLRSWPLVKMAANSEADIDSPCSAVNVGCYMPAAWVALRSQEALQGSENGGQFRSCPRLAADSGTKTRIPEIVNQMNETKQK
jgi:hypothetical protein